MDQNFYYIGLKSTSASYTSAFTNALPAVTFILALIFRYLKTSVNCLREIKYAIYYFEILIYLIKF